VPLDRTEIERRIHRSACFQRAFTKDADGELVLNEINLFAGLNKDTFNEDPYISAYNAGRRSVAIFIKNCIEQDTKKAEEILKNAEPQTQ
jgi:hypothetical protein